MAPIKPTQGITGLVKVNIDVNNRNKNVIGLIMRVGSKGCVYAQGLLQSSIPSNGNSQERTKDKINW